MKRSAALLLVLALCGAALLAMLQHFAAPRIEAQRQLAAERALLDLLPAGSYDNRPLQHPIALPAGGLLDNAHAEQGYLASLNGQPSAVLLPVTGKGYEGPIRLLVAVTPDGQLLASKVLQQQETPGLADLLAPERASWLRGFDGKTLGADAVAWTLRTDQGQVDQIAGATVTSRAVTDALQRALRFFDAERQRLLAVQP
jgi:electron transport complex protein RnfG